MNINQATALTRNPAISKYLFSFILSPTFETIIVKIKLATKKEAQVMLTERIFLSTVPTYKAYRGPSKLPAKTKIPLKMNKVFNGLLDIYYFNKSSTEAPSVFVSLRRGWDLVTDNFLLKISSTPPRAAVLRLSNPTPSQNDTLLKSHSGFFADHFGGDGI